MTAFDPQYAELFDLFEAACEDRLTDEQASDLEAAVLADATARTLFVEYMALHGTLHWDAAASVDAVPYVDAQPIAEPVPQTAPASEPVAKVSRRGWGFVLIAAALLIAVGTIFRPGGETPSPAPIADNDSDRNETEVAVTPTPEIPDLPTNPEPLKLPGGDRLKNPGGTPLVNHTPVVSPSPERVTIDGEPVVFINERIRDGWNDAQVVPSPAASDAEWLRRVYLDVVGRIPTPDEVTDFLAASGPNRKADLVDRLLDSSEFAGNMATVWTNLLVGRSRDVIEREPLEDYLRLVFAENRPWSETVAELVSATGSPEENGASSFLLAHLNNEAVPATAITARVFLGEQVQCMQCHDHPSPANSGSQKTFWELNSFFKQTEIVERKRDGKTVRELVSKPDTSPTFYEDRRGVMKTATPTFGGEEVAGSEADLRKRLAELMITGDRTQVAAAMVNRTWAHFFGRGFTLPVDDMGPHNPPTHPQLLEGLASEFVESRYDVKQLVRWIVLSEPYGLSSTLTVDNEVDDPDRGELPLFSRVYLKPMSAEQVFESLATAAGKSSSESQNLWQQRQTWLQHFVHAFETEENNELTQFDGTIPQALEMMNGDLVESVTTTKPGSLLDRTLKVRGGLEQKATQLALATVSRKPTRAELAAVRQIHRQRASRGGANRATEETLQDLLWAYLNSSEFILVH